MSQIKFRIYTENVVGKHEDISRIISDHLPSCTRFYDLGLWEGAPERSLVIEFIGEPLKWVGTIVNLALALKRELNQQAVMITQESVEVIMV
jgi:hypothetical protein